MTRPTAIFLTQVLEGIVTGAIVVGVLAVAAGGLAGVSGWGVSGAIFISMTFRIWGAAQGAYVAGLKDGAPAAPSGAGASGK